MLMNWGLEDNDVEGLAGGKGTVGLQVLCLETSPRGLAEAG